MPNWKPAIRARLAGLRLEPTREAEIVEELAQHLEDKYQEGRGRGMAEAEARTQAQAELADASLLESLLRPIERPAPRAVPALGATNESTWLAGFSGDLRYALRALRRSPGFTIVAVLSLALGSGANAAVFRLLEAIRFRNLPVRAPEELVDLQIENLNGLTGSFNGAHPDFSYPLFERIRDRQKGLSGVFAWSTGLFNLANGGVVRNAQGLWVSGELFPTLGAEPALGRLLGPGDDQPGCAPAAVISHAFWRRELNEDANAVGKTVSLDGIVVPIVGVTQPTFFGVEVGRRFDVAVPICAHPILRPGTRRREQVDAWWLAIGGRLERGWTAERVAAQLATISPGLFAETIATTWSAEFVPIYRGYLVGVTDGATGRSRLRTTYESSLWFLLGIGGLVLLIGCANVANLLLARASARQREMAARLALGASRARLLRQLLVESFVIAAVGVGLGALFSQALTTYLVATLTTTGTPLFLELQPSGWFFGLTAIVAVAACLIFGLGPALRSINTPPAGAMRAAGRGLTAGRERHRAQRVLVVGQVALSMVLLVAALLFVRSFRNLLTDDPGFRVDGIVVAELDLSPIRGEERQRAVGRQLLERIRTMPGVASAAASAIIPFTNGWNEDIRVMGLDGKEQPAVVNFAEATEGYFETMEVPLVAGRDFSGEDRPGGPKTAIVNQAFAKRFFGGGSPLGRTLDVVRGAVPDRTTYLIVGLVGDTKYRRLRDGFDPIAYLPASQTNEVSYLNIFARGPAPSELAPAIRRVVTETDPAINLELTELKARVREGLVQDQVMATLSAYFGGLALVLATIGLYGVLAYLVARRTNEVGLRMALGADRRRIVRMIVGEALGLTAMGLVVGTGLTIVAIKLSSVALFGLSPADPVTIAIGAATLAGAALLAGYLPGRKAARVDPMEAIRAE